MSATNLGRYRVFCRDHRLPALVSIVPYTRTFPEHTGEGNKRLTCINSPDYWYNGGAMWGTLLDYRYYTGDKSYDATIMQAMTFQSGESKDYMPKNWSASMGNDDQSFWALSALVAAETGFDNREQLP
jgi:hypothetical protein